MFSYKLVSLFTLVLHLIVAAASETTTSADTSSSGNVVRRILVIGSTGSGKSTLINALAGKKVVDTSSDATVCTSSYTKTKIDKDGVSFVAVGTVGLNEVETGTVGQKDALKMFFEFLKDNQAGFNLIVFCIKEGRLTNEATATYKVMVEGLYSQSGVDPPPVLFVIGGMFDDQIDPQDWCEKNRHAFLLAGYKEAQSSLDQLHCLALPGTSQKPKWEELYREQREESTARAWKAVEKHAVPIARPLYKGVDGFARVGFYLWNFFEDLMQKTPSPSPQYRNLKEGLGLAKLGIDSLYEDLKDFFKSDKMDETL